MLLVMDSAHVFSTADGYSQLWTITWDRINTFLPTLKEELFKSHPAGKILISVLQVKRRFIFHKLIVQTCLSVDFIYLPQNWE
jgi:hypothetical protein